MTKPDEIKRLRQALKTITEHPELQGDPNKPVRLWERGYIAGSMDGHRRCAEIASKALKEK